MRDLLVHLISSESAAPRAYERVARAAGPARADPRENVYWQGQFATLSARRGHTIATHIDVAEQQAREARAPTPRAPPPPHARGAARGSLLCLSLCVSLSRQMKLRLR